MKPSSLRHLRIADLELFLTAARLSSLGRAAALHHLSQSAASAAILRVEDAVGMPLCLHERRQFQLTEVGRSWIPRATECLQQLYRSLSADGGPLRVVMPHSLARLGVPSIWGVAPGLHLTLRRPDESYEHILRGEADVALVLDNASWRGVHVEEIAQGFFHLVAREEVPHMQPVLLAEEQPESIALEEAWAQLYGAPLPIKARLPSWSLIADLCEGLPEVGFLPDFLRGKTQLKPVGWQPFPIPYRVLALFRKAPEQRPRQAPELIAAWRNAFAQEESLATL